MAAASWRLVASAVAADSTLARIVHTVEEAQDRKGEAQRLADRIARPLVPAIMLVAGAVAVIGSLAGDPRAWIVRALVVLVAASPCAFAISVPVTVFAAIGAATRTGNVIKGRRRTGTTRPGSCRRVRQDRHPDRNQPTVVDIATHGADRATVLGLAATLEANSDHPLATAITGAATHAGGATDVHTVAGAGVTGTVTGHRIRLGSPTFVPPGPLTDDVQRMMAAGASVVVVERDDHHDRSDRCAQRPKR